MGFFLTMGILVGGNEYIYRLRGFDGWMPSSISKVRVLEKSGRCSLQVNFCGAFFST